MIIDARAHVTNPAGRYKVSRAGVKGSAVHHSVTIQSADTTIEAELAHIRLIDRDHVAKDFGGFGYHLAGFPSGRLYQTGDLDGARAHVANRNGELIGIVAIGNFVQGFPGAAQMAAIAEGLRFINDFYGRQLEIKGHNQWATPGNGTECAGVLNGFDWSPFMYQAPAIPERTIPEADLRLGAIRTLALEKYRPVVRGRNGLDELVVELLNKDGTPASPPIFMAVPGL